MKRWAKSPKYLLRADAVKRISRDCKPGSFLEVGAGTGELSQTFLARGFHGFLYDLGVETRSALRARFYGNNAVKVVEDLDDVPNQSVDFIFAFEVLEHIVDDTGVLASWCRKLCPGGCVLVSVPAHQRLYGPTDARVGHVRRYDRAQLRDLLIHAGLEVERIACYGFPLGNLGRMVGNVLERESRVPASEVEAQRRSVTSGVEQSQVVVRASRLLNNWTLGPFIALQRLAFSTDLGDGYVARAIAPERVGA